MSKNTVYPWWQVASDIAASKGYGDAALEELAKSQWQKRKRHGEDAVDETGGFIDLDECHRDPVQVAAEAEINDDIYHALKDGRLQAYYPDSRPMAIDDVLNSGMRLRGVCVEPVRVNALLEANGHPPRAWVPKKQTRPTQPPAPGSTWQDKARAIADELDQKDAAVGAHDSVTSMGNRVAAEMRKRQIYGPNGPLSGSTVKREALQGGLWVRPRDKESAGETGDTAQAE